MTKPVIDPSQLTEEQREKIRNLFENCAKRITKTPSLECGVNIGSKAILQVLFGKSMFEKRENNG